MAAMYESWVPSPEVWSEAFSVEENQIGYVAFIKGCFAGSDLFGSAEVQEDGETPGRLLFGLP